MAADRSGQEMTARDSLLQAVRKYADAFRQRYSLHGRAQPEAQLGDLVPQLLADVGKSVGIAVRHHAEALVEDRPVRPDLGVFADGLLCGHVELKAPGKGADPERFHGHDRRQWAHLALLPNLLLTDGLEWSLFRTGERVGTVRLRVTLDRQRNRALDREAACKLGRLLEAFLRWEPVVPHDPRQLAAYLAPLARFLREEVEEALRVEGSSVALLADEWRGYFFPEADDEHFADAYAQTLTYALLLARLSGADDLRAAAAADALDRSNGVLAQALRLLGQKEARERLRVGFELLERALAALDPHDLQKGRPDLWLYFYEDFLAAYDPKLRRDYGVYYTPKEVVELQVRLAAALLRDRFGKALGFADDGVVVLDPAAGTGTYLVAVVDEASRAVTERFGAEQAKARLESLANRLHGFEILVGPYAVAHVRVAQAFEDAGARVHGRLPIFLADTLESPNREPSHLTLTYRQLTEEHEAARRLKNEGEILVCLGNPPYDRHEAGEGGGWVRYGDQIAGGARGSEQERPILEDFLEPARKAGHSVHLKNLYNLYVYFWRWALWRLYEQQRCGGILTFITAASYLKGPAFVGMREHMRRTFDELWILDLGGDNLGTRKSPNVFAIQIPVAIAVGVRGPKANPDSPATVRYARIDAPTREKKLERLAEVGGFDALDWRVCPTGWQDPFVPAPARYWARWPYLTELLPWQHSGVEFKRTWPIGETDGVLRWRLDTLRQLPEEQRRKALRETDARPVSYEGGIDLASGCALPPLSRDRPANYPTIICYAHRSFDRKRALADSRPCDRPRPELWATASERQVFLTSLLTTPLGSGPALLATPHVPDRHHFRGSFGGKDVIPLYRDREGKHPNVTKGLPEALGRFYGFVPDALDIAAYCYGLMATGAYTERFWNELEHDAPRVPLTRDPELFRKVSELGRELLWLHTFAERCRDPARGRGADIPRGTARLVKAIPPDPAAYPDDYAYDAATRTLRVGSGVIEAVAPEVWAFEVSGLRVLDSWLGYRMRERKGKKSSPLDDIRPEVWEPWMTEELLRVIWILERTLDLEPKARELLASVCTGACFLADELPKPSDDERRPPKVRPRAEGQTEMAV